MSAVNDVLNRLRSELGLGESPPGSNHNMITQWYNANVAHIGDGAWCEMTQTWAMWTAGLQSLKVGRAYTVYGAQDGQKGAKGASWHWGMAGMRAGDQYYIDWSGSKGHIGGIDHTGRCEKVMGDGTIYGLEGNISDHLLRVRRDNKYIVGYVRPNFPAAPAAPPVAKPVARPRPRTVPLVVAVQRTLEVTADGKWGSNTDARAQRMRTAARTHAGYPRNVRKPFVVRDVQLIIDTKPDGIWGPNSQAGLVRWIKQFQSAVRVTADGQWGPKTDNAYLSARKHNLNNF